MCERPAEMSSHWMWHAPDNEAANLQPLKEVAEANNGSFVHLSSRRHFDDSATFCASQDAECNANAIDVHHHPQRKYVSEVLATTAPWMRWGEGRSPSPSA